MGSCKITMLEEIKSLLTARYGERWLNSVNNQNGIAEDLSIFEKDVMRISRKFGLAGRGMCLSSETEVIARYEVVRPVTSLFDLDSIFYNWWGHRASENISYVQREIADDELIYHFVTGTPTHGHSGRIILMGREVRNVIHKRWERRIKKLEVPDPVAQGEAQAADKSANN
jgi:hypothetical protein